MPNTSVVAYKSFETASGGIVMFGSNGGGLGPPAVAYFSTMHQSLVELVSPWHDDDDDNQNRWFVDAEQTSDPHLFVAIHTGQSLPSLQPWPKEPIKVAVFLSLIKIPD